jgi:hypothetical protein
MTEALSLLNVIRQGGFEASLITTYNATLPFYEEVVLRRLVAAGCQQNIVLMDRAQCAASWSSVASRPRLAGAAYTLLPLDAPGAFHPKVCVLVGKNKAAVLVGSHNLTLSGFGYNREITNWVQVTNRQDEEGVALLHTAWRMLRQWIEDGRKHLPAALIEAALSVSGTLAQWPSPSCTIDTGLLFQQPGGPALIDQIRERVTGDIARIVVTGAFFDRELAFVAELERRWPSAEVVVAIDPDTVHLPAMRPLRARFVNALRVWSNGTPERYLHAKAMYIEPTAGDRSIIVSGSANPSRQGWMGTSGTGNVEAMLLRVGPAARDAAEALGLRDMMSLPGLAEAELWEVFERSNVEPLERDADGPRLLVGIVAGDHMLEISCEAPLQVDRVELLSDNDAVLGVQENVKQADALVRIVIPDEVGRRVRSCRLYYRDREIARAMVAYPDLLKAPRKGVQRQLREALGAVDPSGETIENLLTAVEKALFDDAAEAEVEGTLRSRRPTSALAAGERPASLEVGSVEMPGRRRRRRRLVESADLVTIIELLSRAIGSEVNLQSGAPTDHAGRSEEEQVGQEDGTEPSSQVDESSIEADSDGVERSLRDAEIARRIQGKVGKLVGRMLAKLEQAGKTEEQGRAIVQLIAVLSLLKELMRTEQLSRWRTARAIFVAKQDRQRLLDSVTSLLFGSEKRLIQAVGGGHQAEPEEVFQLRVLLLWLAWSVNTAVPRAAFNPFSALDDRKALRAMVLFLELAPRIAVEDEARELLQRHIGATYRPTPKAAAQAHEWLRATITFGRCWSGEPVEAPDIKSGGCCWVGDCDTPRLVVQVSGDSVGLWDDVKPRGIHKSWVIGVRPAIAA